MASAPSTDEPSFTAAAFHDAVGSLPDELQPRLTRLRQYAISGRPHHRTLRVLLAELFALASTGADMGTLAGKTAEAEQMWARLRAEAQERQAREQQQAMHRPDQWRRAISKGYHGRIPRWTATSAPLVAATDASRKGPRTGWGYVVSDGRWGLRHSAYWGDDPTGPAAVLVSELRAVYFLLSVLDPATHLRLLIDSKQALHLLSAWRAGDDTMPRGYDLRPRARAEAPTLVLLARRVAQMPHLSLSGVRAHRGHPLNEAAHSLSVIARRAYRANRGFELPEEMAGMVDRFLTSWHAGADRRLPGSG